MLSSVRVRGIAGLVAVAFAAACGESEPLPTTLDTAATDADIAAFESSFEQPQVEALVTLGYEMDLALAGVGAPVMRMPLSLLRDGTRQPLLRYESQVKAVLSGEVEPAVIPLQALGKTFVWSTVENRYVVSELTGAPAGGVRFIIYQVDSDTQQPVQPLVEIGYVELTRNANSATLAAFGNGGTKVMEYTATIGGTQLVPSLSIDGFVGVGVNRVNFNLSLAVSLTRGTVTVTWRTEMPSRRVSSRVTLGIGETAVVFGAQMRAGLRRVDMGGTLGENGGTITVRVGGKVFARLVFDAFDGVTITNADGQPLTPEEEETLERIFRWFEVAFGAPDALMAPLYTILDFEVGLI